MEKGKDILYGDDGDDYLNGGEGADIMAGGAGNDIYIVDNERDVVVEENLATRSNNGESINYDVVYSLVSINVPKNVEEIHLLSSGI